MLCSQFLACSLQESHPSHEIVTMPSGPRSDNRKSTLQSKFFNRIAHLLTDGITPPDQYRSIIQNIHSATVSAFKRNQGMSRVLSAVPPEVSGEEVRLPRHHRTTLSQLRSGHCIRLRDYQKLIGKSGNDICPECESGVHTVAHLFACPAHPTSLTPLDLWQRPIEVARFLRGMTAFAELPPLDPPVPPPPPEPPPS